MEPIKLEMSWTVAARIYATALENGTDEGKAMARKAIVEMGELIDMLIEEREEQNQ